jgi:hypothetical protein
LAKSGRDYTKWASLKRGLIKRAERSIKLLPQSPGGR